MGKIGTVMVVGGGIAGMQAAMDLSDQGFMVYLVDRESAIGGVMAQLDKTFPTNDCSMCIMAPRLIELAQNENVQIITNADLLSVEGDPGRFKVRLLKRPRFVDLEKCNACGKCLEVCPVEVPDEFNLRINLRKAIYKRYPQALPTAFAISKREIPRCRSACPIHTNVQGYVAMIAQGKFDEAYRINKEVNPFPSICGRICHHPCEEACLRNRVDDAVPIQFLKRFVTDWIFRNGLADQLEPMPPEPNSTGRRIAIVGSGPAGMAAANDLVMLGHSVTVFEALPVAGGMLAVGIPEYRLPKEILKEEIELIARKGVEIKLNTRVGTDVPLKVLLDDYDALFVAAGAHHGRKLDVEGEDLRNVIEAVDFLRQVNLNRFPRTPIHDAKVAVIGGGNVAMDAARTALRLGAKEVTIYYRRSRKEMPADEWELEETEEEGVKFEFLTAPIKLVGRYGKVKAMECIRMELGEPDESGRRRPMPIPGSEYRVDADMVIFAIGQRPDGEFMLELPELRLSRNGFIQVDPDTLWTGVPKLFAGGDIVTGPATVSEAIAQGKRAARAIHRYLNGEEMTEPFDWELKTRELPPIDEEEMPPTKLYEIPRVDIPRRAPEERISSFKEVQLGFDEETAIEQAKRCLNCGICSECMQCVEVCQAEAIEHNQTPEVMELDVGAIILAPGYLAFDAGLRGEYGYRRYPNVITSIEFERYLSASGPTNGHVIRPKDGKEPKKVAFIQCVGSRDVTERGNSYCSSVCCMYAIKQAIIAREHLPSLEPTIFYIDMRAHGKGYERFFRRAQEEFEVRFVRGMISSIKELKRTGDLMIRYVNESGKVVEEKFDMAVLSLGLEPPEGLAQLAERLGLDLNEYGFVRSDPYPPVKTSREGIFACGASVEPQDIPSSVVQAGAAACIAAQMLSESRGTMTRRREYPPERDVRGEPPKVGVFICHCGNNIAGVVDVEAVAEHASKLENVVLAETLLYACSPDGLKRIREAVEGEELTRVVVASCTPRTHEPVFQNTIREAGLNRYLFEMANIRDQCSWAHMHEPELATEKAKELVAAAVAKVRLLEPIEEIKLPVIRSALVIGGGPAGMTAALALADQGFPVHLVERNNALGGNLRHLMYLLNDQDPQKLLEEMIGKVENHPLITLHMESELMKAEGFIGNFRSLIAPKDNPDEPVEVRHGVAIIATGAKEHEPTEYLYGSSDRIVTQRELEERLVSGGMELSGRPIVMIQCVGCRNDERNYCSRICCSVAVKNALKLKEINPDLPVYVLYKDVRTFGFREEFYRRARERGVIFLRYDDEHKPTVQLREGGLKVRYHDLNSEVDGEIEADYVVLSAAVVSDGDAKRLSKIFSVPIDEDGFFLEAHVKLKPVEFATQGVYVCGMAHSPMFLEESIAQAMAAASKATTVLSKDELSVEGMVAAVNPQRCVGCLTCIKACPYQVPKFNEEKEVVEIEPAECHGCGVCVVACFGKAITLKKFEDIQLAESLDALLW
jgi:heterodisulfide reductase subunit A-like polyferredoxin